MANECTSAWLCVPPVSAIRLFTYKTDCYQSCAVMEYRRKGWSLVSWNSLQNMPPDHDSSTCRIEYQVSYCTIRIILLWFAWRYTSDVVDGNLRQSKVRVKCRLVMHARSATENNFLLPAQLAFSEWPDRIPVYVLTRVVCRSVLVTLLRPPGSGAQDSILVRRGGRGALGRTYFQALDSFDDHW